MNNPHLASLIDLVRARAVEAPGATAYTFLHDDGTEESSVTYGELEQRARQIGSWLQRNSLMQERIVLLFPPGPDYVAAFFGCLFAGAVAVPAYPPRKRQSLGRVQAILQDAAPRAVLMPQALLARSGDWRTRVPELDACALLALEESASAAADDWRHPGSTPADLAFLQYTSGSTSLPKGVMVSHGNLLHNEERIRLSFGQSRQSVIVGWLPLYHDMGLIGNILQPLFLGARGVLMSPMSFLQKPVRWLQAISRYRATTSGGPDFAYDLCVRKVSAEERQGLDLSSWEVAFTGAEPVRPGTLVRFAETFAACGFRASAFHPCYGLAEATLLVSAGGSARRPVIARFSAEGLEAGRVATPEPGRRERELAGCGEVLGEEEVLLVDPATGRRCADGHVGEIWVRGASVAQGYWGRPEDTTATFLAREASTGEGPFLRTGDLGFLEGGELFVTGRLKDLLIVRGRNLHPQDLEVAAERSHPALRPGCSAAFAGAGAGAGADADAADGESEERLVIACELQRGREEEAESAAAAVRAAIAEEHDVLVHEIVFLRIGTIPKTTSGKIQRRATREAWRAGRLERVGTSSIPVLGVAEEEMLLTREDLLVLPTEQRAAAVAAALAGEVARRLGTVPPLDVPLTALGLDSLGALELSHRAEDRFGVPLPISLLLEGASLSRLAEQVAGDLERGVSDRSGTGEAGEAPAGAFPLSFGQEALWFLERLVPGTGACQIAAAARVRGPLRASALRDAFAALAERHPALRTTFSEAEGGPVQQVHSELAPEVSFEDTFEDAGGWSRGRLETRLAAAAWTPFDLAHGPLLRITVLSLSPEEHLLVLAVHHLVADFWSLVLLVRELGALYAGDAIESAADPGYAGFVAWQRRRLTGADGKRLLDYWSERLAGAPPDLALPADRPVPSLPSLPSHRGASRSRMLGAPLTADLAALARERSTTPFVVALAAFQALLARIAGQEDLVVGSPLAGRTSPEWSAAVGYFVQPAALRADLSGSPGFGELVDQARGAVLGALQHQDAPLAWLAERLQISRALGSPFFRAMFVFQKAQVPGWERLGGFALGEEGAGSLELGGLTWEAAALPERRVQFDLSLTAAQVGEHLGLSLEYATDLFDAATAERLLGRFEVLLAGAVAEPGCPVSLLPLLTGAEQLQLQTWNATQRDWPHDRCLHELFAEQAAATPEAIALESGDESWTYRDLAGRVRRLAAHLQSLGVGPETRVGVCLERRPRLVEALLGVLSAGGAYVPLDPSYPRERLALLLEDSGAAVVISTPELLDLLPVDLLTAAGARHAHQVLLDGELPDRAPAPTGVSPSNLAYLIYTSGSTGRPKAVGIEHRSAATLVRWARETFTSGELSGVAASTSISFDLSVFELFVPLSLGGRVVLLDNALAIAQLGAEAGVSLLNTVPSALAELVRSGGVPETVRTVCLAGEPLPRRLVEEIYGLGFVERVWNLYGPSEDTTYSTGAVIEPGAGRAPSIGSPIAGTRAHVLDGGQSLVPVGVVGELYLAGEGLARGYLGRPELTAERFVPDPFGEAGERLYRTGDLVRWRPEGELEFLGRADSQVKVRGFRIELGEIEAVLGSHPAVREAAVLALEEPGGGRRLVGCVAGSAPTEELRSWLRERLPEHMVPSAFVGLEMLPLTPNGKVDRKALARLAPQREEKREGGAPQTPVEEMLAGIWEEVLGVEGVGGEDHFFDLGGHSLLATRVMSRVRQAFGVDLALRELFAAPSLRGLAQRIERSLSSGAEAEAPPLVRVERSGPLPLSFAQERLWFLDQLRPGGTAYTMSAVLRLEGPLAPAVLALCLAEISRRHEVLRTSFPVVAGRPVQRIAPEGPAFLPLIDLSALDPERREAEAGHLAAADADRPFDLANGPLLRIALVRLSGERHALLLALHHAIADGVSLAVFGRELSVLYTDLAEGAEGRPSPSPLPEPPVQYADFAAWQRSELAEERIAALLAWWRERLAGAPPVLELPTDRPRPAVQGFRGASVPFHLDPAVGAGLRALARRRGATPFMVWLAGFQALLSRHAGQDGLTVGVPVAGRTRPELEGLIGFFVNTLVLRGDLSGAPSFADLVARARWDLLEAHSRQDLPFERLVEELQPGRDLSRTPLFQVTLSFESFPVPTALGPVGLSFERPASRSSKFDLSLAVEDAGESFLGTLEYDADLWDRSTVEALLARFHRLLAGAVEDPARPAADLPLLSEAERLRLMTDAAGRALPVPAAPVHELFAVRAAAAPDALAVAAPDRSFTYGELDREANRLARHLRALGVGPEVSVAVLLDRSAEMVLAWLAVLKAGGAYVPLDAASPEDRLAFLAADSGAAVLLSRGGLPRLSLPGAALVLLDADHAVIAAQPADPLPAGLAVESSLAYAIYTSGSTGRPKGVGVPHRGLSNLVAWHLAEYGVAAADRATQLAAPGFDAAVWEVWPVLASGASLHLPAEEVRTSPQRLAAWLVEQGITLSFLPTPLAEAVLEQPWPEDPEEAPLRALLTGGDRLHRRPRPGLPFRLVNHYGPTEGSVVATAGEVEPALGETGAAPQAPHIGRPIANVRACVLDREQRLAVPGGVGELCLGGAGLARGYLGRPDATAAAFVPDPWSGEPGARLYRSGDLVRLQPDGSLDFLGRADHQVKVRGVRIELGELAAVLAEHPAVSGATAALRAAPSGEERLVAWAAVGEGAMPPVAELRAFLRHRLPEVMVPAEIVTLPELPLTAHGKVDRRALPEPAWSRNGDAVPRTPAEELIAGLWCELLGLGRIGRQESFFDLGGHSLLAARLVARLRDAFGVDLPLQALFAAPTVEGVAAAVAAAVPAPARPPVRPVPHSGPAPLSFAQQRLWFLDQLAPGHAFYNIAAALRLRGPLDVAALERALGEVLRRHEILRTVFPKVGGEPFAVVEPLRAVALPPEELLPEELPPGDPEGGALRRATEEARRPFDLARGPLFRSHLLRLGAEDHLLALSVHHIVADGWSVGIFLDELAVLYGSCARGEASPLADPDLQYADFSAWQREWLADDALAAQVAFWKRHLGRVPPALPLPYDRPRPPVQAHRGVRSPFVLPRDLADRVRAAGRSQTATLFMTALAALEVLLYRYTGQEDFAVGTVTANRERPEAERLIGFFVNTLALRADVGPEVSGEELLARVRRTALEAYAHQELPFEKLLEELEVVRDPGASPLFQVMLVVQNTPSRPPALPGLEAELTDLDTGTAKFDLTLCLVESDGDLAGWTEHDTDLFDAATVERLLGHLQIVLGGLAEAPDRPVWALPLLTAQETGQLQAWSGEIPPGDEVCVHRLFAEQAARAPEALAVAQGDRRLTYGELDRRAEQLVGALRARGVGPETVAAVCLERGADLVIAALAVLKAGGAYLPIDPATPAERLAWMLGDAGVRVLVTTERLVRPLLDGAAPPLWIPVHTADDTADDTANDTGADLRPAPAPAVTPAHRAYVIYTSGSTGVPKAVEVEHRGLWRLVRWHLETYGVTPDDRATQIAGPGFDAAVWEIWPYLAAGASLHIPDETTRTVPARLAAWLREEEITLTFLPTPLAEAVIAEPSAAGLGLRALLTGGDRLHRGAPGRCGFRLVNHYGPTENSVVATWSEVAAEEVLPPIGQPIAGTRVHVLDPWLEPVPVGVAGELYLGGASLARGYLGRPELTAERFVPDPWQRGLRLYRTGDLVRFRADGRLDFIGRADGQIKIRGFRIELGEIEAVLQGHPGVREAAVVHRGAAGSGRLVAYVVSAAAAGMAMPTAGELRHWLRDRLPDPMVPADFAFLEALPLNASGKVDRRALPALETARLADPSRWSAPRTEIERTIAEVWQRVLDVDRVGLNDNFFELGGHSLALVKVHAQLQEVLGAELDVVDLFRHTTVSALARHLSGEEEPLRPEPGERGRNAPVSGDVAVVAVSGRFPGAPDVDTFWRNLRDGVESISFFSQEEILAAGIEPALAAHPSYVRAGGVLEDIDLFDAAFFGLSPRETEMLDPQHRLFLECASQALERAGYDSERYPGRIGVYAGVTMNGYLFNVFTNQVEEGAPFLAKIGTDKDFLATRVSYKLNLDGPSVSVQTACSTSLVAIHLACRALVGGECEMALAGGVSVRVPHKDGYLFQEGGIMSPDGHCRAFDAAARGTVNGSGVGIVVLKRLEDALADGDQVLAVVKGSAINNDGSAKVGYTAPSIDGQLKVILSAQRCAGVDPRSISYVEAHGTGTALGDPIEIAALTRAFRVSTEERGFCAVGSLKTNIGHLDSAAGVAGMIKAVLALRHGEIPPSLHFESPNPKIDFAASPFYVADRLLPWKGEGPRRAAVNSFGIGGTNAHVILEEAPPQLPSGPSRPRQLLVLSARTATALDAASENLARFLEENAAADLAHLAHLADMAFTLSVGRRVFPYRRTVLCDSAAGAAEALRTLDPARVLTAHAEETGQTALFLFPGQGAQHAGMGRELYREEPLFRAEVDHCCEILRPLLGLDLRETLFPAADRIEEAEEALRQTWLTQPALFVVEWALARLWMSWGVQPAALLGHSVGEFVAACLAGVFSLEDALELIALRGRLIQELPPGSMISMPLPEEEVRELLGDALSLAAVNAPSRCVVAGPAEAVHELERRMVDRGVEARRLRTSHAFHSAMMDPVLASFAAAVGRIELHPPRLRILSNLTGDWMTEADATDPFYWARHLRDTVRFGDCLGRMLREVPGVLLEVGPGRTLASFAARHPDRTPDRPVLSSLPRAEARESAAEALFQTLGRLWLHGATIAWDGFWEGQRRTRCVLPTYCFERRRFWMEPQRMTGLGGGIGPSLGKRPDLASWFYSSSWQRTAPPAPLRAGEIAALQASWLLFIDGVGLGALLIEKLEREGCEPVVVVPGGAFRQLGERSFEIDPSSGGDYIELLAALGAAGRSPSRIVHLWSVSEPGEPVRSGDVDAALDLGFHSIVLLAQALGRYTIAATPIRLDVVSNDMQRVGGETEVRPEKATLLGPCRVIPLEYPHIACRSLDLGGLQPRRIRRMAERLASELALPGPGEVLAFRGDDRWVERFEPIRLDEAGLPRLLRDDGVYLITGGLGGVGLTLAEHLARKAHARLVLVGRTPLPPREEWPHWLEVRGPEDRLGRSLRSVLALEEMGAQVMTVVADVADREQLRAALEEARERFGAIHGVIHSAGVPGGGLIQRKTREEAVRVLAPKVHGTLALAELLEGEELDFVLLCSSLNSVLGAVGQADYCAANAFLDAFAGAATAAGGPLTLSVAWDRWEEVGMAVETALPPGLESVRRSPRLLERFHPLLDECVSDGEGEIVYRTRFDVSRHWVLSEHRIMGHPVIPGTTYLEMLRAVFARHIGGPLEIRKVQFMTPLRVPEGESREVWLRLLDQGDGSWSFTLQGSAGEAGGEAVWQDLGAGTLARSEAAPPDRYDLDEIVRRCDAAERVFTDADLLGKAGDEDLIRFGPRWRNLRWIRAGRGEAIAFLELPAKNASDCEQVLLHPALLDIGVGYAVQIAGEGDYLPFAYRGLEILAPFPSHVYSHSRFAPAEAGNRETVGVEVTFLDGEGNELARIAEFTLKRVNDRGHLPGVARSAAPEGAAPPRPRAAGDGILPSEGAEVFARLLAGGSPPQVLVCTKDLIAFAEQSRQLTQTRLLEQIGDRRSGGSVHPRPALQTPFVAPRTELEHRLAAIWASLLGIEPIGVHDDFFEIGGDSVAGVRLVARASEAGLTLTPAQIFEYPTIAGLALVLGDSAGQPAASAPEPVEETAAPMLVGSPTTADFPDAEMSEEDLAHLLGSLAHE